MASFLYTPELHLIRLVTTETRAESHACCDSVHYFLESPLAKLLQISSTREARSTHMHTIDIIDVSERLQEPFVSSNVAVLFGVNV